MDFTGIRRHVRRGACVHELVTPGRGRLDGQIVEGGEKLRINVCQGGARLEGCHMCLGTGTEDVGTGRAHVHRHGPRLDHASPRVVPRPERRRRKRWYGQCARVVKEG